MLIYRPSSFMIVSAIIWVGSAMSGVGLGRRIVIFPKAVIMVRVGSNGKCAR